MAIIYTQQNVFDTLLRAKRAMLIISDKIQNEFIYNYSEEYTFLKGQQYDIYALKKVITNENAYNPYTSNPDIDEQHFYGLVGELINKCAYFDEYGDYGYTYINFNYQDTDQNPVIVSIIGATRFIDLTDVLPNSYAGQARRYVVVNDAETGVTFIDEKKHSYTFSASDYPTGVISITYDAPMIIRHGKDPFIQVRFNNNIKTGAVGIAFDDDDNPTLLTIDLGDIPPKVYVTII